MSGIIVGGVIRSAPGVNVQNYLHPNLHEFTGRARRLEDVTEIVIHESVTLSHQSTVETLMRRGGGVHFIIAADGTVAQHADVLTRLSHASQHNSNSVGIEIVNPYYPRWLRDGLPWRDVIDAPWAHEGEYVLPTPAQLEAVSQLIDWLTSAKSGLKIPRRWLGLSGSKFALGRVPAAERPSKGVLAHTYFNHADGGFAALYAWLRIERLVSAATAFDLAQHLTEGAREYADISGIPVPRIRSHAALGVASFFGLGAWLLSRGFK